MALFNENAQTFERWWRRYLRENGYSPSTMLTVEHALGMAAYLEEHREQFDLELRFVREADHGTNRG